MSRPRPSIETLRELIGYNPETGDLRWRSDRKILRAGALADSKKHSGYKEVRFSGMRVYSHIVAWALHYGAWPIGLIDHIDGDPSNNRIANLRLADKSKNGFNRGAGCRSKTGVKGVFPGRNGRYRVELKVRGKLFYIGEFKTLDEAKEAYAQKAKSLHGEFVRLA